MGNSIPGGITKMLTFVPIVVAVYYFDLAKFETVFTSLSLLPFFVLTLSVFGFGVVLKRRVLAARFELSGVSFPWGVGLLVVSAALYVYGSYSNDVTWYHYESLYVLILAYTALRIGPGILRALAPLLAILPLSFLPLALMPDLVHQELLAFLAADCVALFFLVYARLQLRAVLLPTLGSALALLGWFAYTESFPVHYQYLDLLIPVPLLVGLIPPIRRFVSLRGAPLSMCSGHNVFPDGFCAICGLKVARARTGENFGLWGLLAVLGFAFLLVLGSIPALALVNGTPYEAQYTPQGATGIPTPMTPSGWQVNSSMPEKLGSGFLGEIYSINETFVPIFHPETKNYTMYYELAVAGPPASSGPFGVDLPGYNRTLDELVPFGPFQGHLNGYVAPGKVFITYHGTTYMDFLIGGRESKYAVGLGFTRVFHNSNITQDTAQFLADLNQLWLPNIESDVSYSAWSLFISNLEFGAQSIQPSVVTIVSIAVLFFVAYRATLSDDRLDRFLGLAPLEPTGRWSILSRLLGRRSRLGTGQELASSASRGDTPSDSLVKSLQELENRRLVRRDLVERGPELVSVWRVEA